MDILQLLGSIGILGEPPRTMEELERALGVRFVDSDLETSPTKLSVFEPKRTLGGVLLGLSAGYGWDMYHENYVTTADDLRRRRVYEFTLNLARGRSAIAQALYQRFGAPHSARDAIIYERWIIHEYDARTDACKLSHFEKLPDWAIPPADAAVRRRVLLEIVAAAARADKLDEVERIAKSAPPESGIVCAGSDRSPRIELVPAIAALELASILGWERPVGVSSDINQSSWTLKIMTIREDGVVAIPPAYGRWCVGVALDSGASGGPVGQSHATPGCSHFLGRNDLVRTFHFYA
jgi:hypothetical protein